MQELMLGNAAVARGLYEAGCRVVSSYPGTPSTEITEVAGRFSELNAAWAPNEKVGAEVALGAAIGGARAFTAMKHVGLNVAADVLFTASYTGINAGFVWAVADDQGMHSSQNEQDSRHYAVAAKLPMLEPSDAPECLSFTKLAFELSEEYDTPVMLRLSTRVSHSQGLLDISPRIEPPIKQYTKNAAKYVMAPANAKRRHPVVEARQEALAAWAETSGVNRVELAGAEIGVIASGAAYTYAKEALPNASFLKLGMVNPLPTKLILDFASKVDKLYVIEELDPIIENHCKLIGVKVIGKELFSLCGEYGQRLIKEKILGEKPAVYALAEDLPARPPVMCAGCTHRPVFYTLKKLGVNVIGDIGCYTLGASEPLNAVDTTVCMGFSVSGLAGFNLANGNPQKTVAVIGDSTFIHSGLTGLINLVYSGANATVLILDNAITAMTGHQDNPATGRNLQGREAARVSIEALCTAAGAGSVRVVDPFDLCALKEAVETALSFEGVSVVIARSPCALLKKTKSRPPMAIEGCKGCKKCMEIGCPAIRFEGRKAHLDDTLCTGCGLCSGLCAFGCISASGEARA